MTARSAGGDLRMSGFNLLQLASLRRCRRLNILQYLERPSFKTRPCVKSKPRRISLVQTAKVMEHNIAVSWRETHHHMIA